MTYLRPDSKSQVTVEYSDDNVAQRIDTIVVSTQHDEFITAQEAGSQEKADLMMLEQIRRDVEEILIPRVMIAAGRRKELNWIIWLMFFLFLLLLATLTMLKF